MAIGIAACEVQNEAFTGPELYAKLLETEFDGVSGHVAFDTRRVGTVGYRVVGVLADEPNSISNVTFTMGVDSVYVNLEDRTVDVVRPYRFSDGTTMVPSPSRVVGEDRNLISKGVLYFTMSVALAVMILWIGCAWWTIRNRKKRVVRRSQPDFPCMLCVGPCLMAATVGFQGFQEPLSKEMRILHACFTMAYIDWFHHHFCRPFLRNMADQSCLQESTEIPACKKVRVQDVLWPFAVLFATNVAVLTAWNIVDPLKWERITLSEDEFGRPTASYGTCFLLQGRNWAFLSTSISLCVLALVIANYQSFLARNLPSDYSEAYLSGHHQCNTVGVRNRLLQLYIKVPESLYLV